jgi:hypothetical protein
MVIGTVVKYFAIALIDRRAPVAALITWRSKPNAKALPQTSGAAYATGFAGASQTLKWFP